MRGRIQVVPIAISDRRHMHRRAELNLAKDGNRAPGETGTAIVIDAAGCLEASITTTTGIDLVLMIVVAEMLRGGIRLVLTIDTRRLPSGLEWQENKEQNGEAATHSGTDYSRGSFIPQS